MNEIDLKNWAEANGFVWTPYSHRSGKADGDMICQLGIVTAADDGSRLIAIVADYADEHDDDEPVNIAQALSRVSVRTISLSEHAYAYEFEPELLGHVAALMRACRSPVDEIPWRAVVCRLAWRRKAQGKRRDCGRLA